MKMQICIQQSNHNGDLQFRLKKKRDKIHGKEEDRKTEIRLDKKEKTERTNKEVSEERRRRSKEETTLFCVI